MGASKQKSLGGGKKYYGGSKRFMAGRGKVIRGERKSGGGQGACWGVGREKGGVSRTLVSRQIGRAERGFGKTAKRREIKTKSQVGKGENCQ